MTRPTAAPSGFFPEHSFWNVEPPSSGMPSVPGAEQRAPARALPGSQSWNLPEATGATQYQGETRDIEAAAPPWLSGPSTLRCSKHVQPLLTVLPKKGAFATRSALPQPRQLQPGPAKSFTWQCLSQRRAGGTVPAGALPRERPNHRVPAPPLAAVEKVG